MAIAKKHLNFINQFLVGNFEMVARFKDMPPQPGQPEIPENAKDKIMNMSLPISKEII